MNEDPALIDEIKGHKNTLLAVKFSPDSKNVIAAGVDSAIYFHKLDQSNYHYKILCAHDDIIYSLDYGRYESTGVHFFLSASRDQTVKLWKIDSANQNLTSDEFEPTVYRCHSNTIRFVNICPLNNSLFCTGSDDKTIKVWSTNIPNKRLNTFANHTNWIRCCKFSKQDANLIASCGDDSTLRLFDMRINGMKGSILKTITTARNRHFTRLHWYPLSEYFIAISSSNNMIRLFDLRNKARIIQFYKQFNDSVNSLEFHPSGHHLLACSSDATSKLIDVTEGRPLYTLKAHYKSIFDCTWSSDGSRFITCGKDRTMKLWKFCSKSNYTMSDWYASDEEQNKSNLMDASLIDCSINMPVNNNCLSKNHLPVNRLADKGLMHRTIEHSANTDRIDLNNLNKALSATTSNRSTHCLNHHHPHCLKYNNPLIKSSTDYYSSSNRNNFLTTTKLVNHPIELPIDQETVFHYKNSGHKQQQIDHGPIGRLEYCITDSELNDILSQLNILEDSLSKLEIRLSNLENRLTNR